VEQEISLEFSDQLCMYFCSLLRPRCLNRAHSGMVRKTFSPFKSSMTVKTVKVNSDTRDVYP